MTPAARRQVIDVLTTEHRLSVRRACRLVGLARAAWYQPLVDPAVRDAAVIDVLLGGRVKSRNFGTGQNQHFLPVTETSEFYFVGSSVRKSVWTFVRQLRGPHFRTCA